MKLTQFLLFSLVQPLRLQAFTTPKTNHCHAFSETRLSATQQDSSSLSSSSLPLTISSRRTWLQQSLLASAAAAAATITTNVTPAWAATRPPLPDLLYTILRVREATEQESRLITSGKFKDVQRANVKLAVRFMVENYRLNDALVAAAAYLDGNDRRIAAGNVGSSAVQNLMTILEYFDSADVQNLKVGSNSMAGKEALVLKGLDAARRNIDEFLSYFPAAEIDAAKVKIASENKLNLEEFDPELGGAPINLAAPGTKA